MQYQVEGASVIIRGYTICLSHTPHQIVGVVSGNNLQSIILRDIEFSSLLLGGGMAQVFCAISYLLSIASMRDRRNAWLSWDVILLDNKEFEGRSRISPPSNQPINFTPL